MEESVTDQSLFPISAAWPSNEKLDSVREDIKKNTIAMENIERTFSHFDVAGSPVKCSKNAETLTHYLHKQCEYKDQNAELCMKWDNLTNEARMRSKNIEALKTRLSELDEELTKYNEEKKTLRKEHKRQLVSLHKVLDYYETHFDLKVDAKQSDEGLLIATVCFKHSGSERSVKISVNIENKTVNLLDVSGLNIEGQEEIEHITATFCVLRDILLDKI